MAISREDGVDDSHHRSESGQKKHESLNPRLLELEYGGERDGDNHPSDKEDVERQVESFLFRGFHIGTKILLFSYHFDSRQKWVDAKALTAAIFGISE